MTEIRFGIVNPPLKFYRSRNGYVAGVCQGLAESFDLSPILIRFLWLIAIFCYGFGLGLYLILAISLPRRDKIEQAFNRRLLGVCGKLAKKMEWEVGLVRAAALLLAVGSLGLFVLGYVILYFSFDEAP